MLGELRLLAAPRALALFGESRFEPLTIDAHPVFRGELDGEVERKAICVVEAEGEVACEARRVDGKLFGTARDDPLGVSQLPERRFQLTGPGIERPRELALLAGDGRKDLSRRSTRCGYASPITSMTTAPVSAMN